MHKNHQSNRKSFIEKILFDNLLNIKSASNSNGSSGTFRSSLNLDETQIKRLSTIFSNISYEKIKQTSERLNENDRAAMCKSSTSLYSRHTVTPIDKHRTYSAVVTKKIPLNIEPTTLPLQQKNLNNKPIIDKNEINNTKSKKVKATSSSMTSLTLNEFFANNNHQSSEKSFSVSNQIVIHVCDEARRLKQDFLCPRDLLMREMKYFTHNLNITLDDTQTSSQNSSLLRKTLDEIDISVHCDINIFDWLMKYVKRNHPFLIESSMDGDKPLEPKLEISNCISILLSSDFLIMHELVDKCIVFIAKNLEAVLQIQFAFNGISEQILAKLAACIHADRLDNIYDRKDKLKTKLFQRKLEYLFDINKYKQVFDSNSIFKSWRNDKVQLPVVRNKLTDAGKSNDDEQVEYYTDNYTNFLYECENDASTLFRCKLCNHFMTKQQSMYLKCQLAILNPYGDYIYLHVPDDKFEMTNLLQCLKDRLKTWQSVYWFIWALIKSFRCRKCTNWYRLVEFNKCRMNENTFCPVHDGKMSNFNSRSNLQNNLSNDTTNSVCSCIYCNHMFEYSSATNLYIKSSIVTEALRSSPNSNEELLSSYIQYILENLEKHKDLLINGPLNPDESLNETGGSLCEQVELLLSTDLKSKLIRQQSAKISNQKPSRSDIANATLVSSFFIDSITGKHVSFLDKHSINLVKLAKLNNFVSPDNNTANTVNNVNTTPTNSSLNHTNQTPTASQSNNQLLTNISLNPMFNINFEFEQFLSIIYLLDVKNIFNSINVYGFLKVDNKMKWETSKSVRMNQDNQREDDLKKFREISSYLIKTKLLDEYQKPATQKSTIANILIQQLNSTVNTANVNLYPGGIYCRVEAEWKQRKTQ